MKKTIVIVLFLAVLSSVAAFATYKTTVSREGSNLYKEVYNDTYYVTRYCYEYVYYEDVLVDESDMWIYFIDSNTKCDLKKVIR